MLDFFGNEKGMEFLKKFASIGPRAVRGTTNIMQSLTTGEVGMAVALNANTVVTESAFNIRVGTRMQLASSWILWSPRKVSR